MKTRFLGQAYASQSKVLSSQTAINIYAESSEGNSDEIGVFYGTPGLLSRYIGTGEVRGVHSVGESIYAVIGSGVYQLDTSYALIVSVGTLPNSSGRVSMIDNGSQVAIAHQDGWHWVAIGGTALAEVALSPGGSILTTQDNYVIYTDTGGLFGITALADLSNLNPLDVATAEGLPDDLVSVLSDHREIWLFGDETTEIWSNTGAAFFPFERSPGGFIEMGCAAKFSPAKIGNSILWLGKDSNGKGVVYRANSYVPARVSTHAIEFAISQYARIDDAIGYSYQDKGHEFYVITFPSADATWVYDCTQASAGWHQRAWLDSQTGALHRHRSNCYATFNGDHVVGDWQNGALYVMSADFFTDDGEEIYRERAWEVDDSENSRIRIDMVELTALTGEGATNVDVIGAGDGFQTTGFFDTGIWASTLWNGLSTAPVPSEPLIWLQASTDSGRNWGYQRIIGMGKLGETQARVRWRRVCKGWNIVLRIGTTMNSAVQWVEASIKAEVLDT